MSARVRRPTDDVATEIYDPERQRALPATPHPAGVPSAPMFESVEQGVTEVTPIPRPAAEVAALGYLDPHPGDPIPPVDSAPHVEPAAPIQHPRGLERSEPIRVISMKDHTETTKPRSDDPRVHLQVRLRSMAEVAGRKGIPVRLGNLAPPRDPKEARARHVRANVVWACVAILLACAISLAIWLVAGR